MLKIKQLKNCQSISDLSALLGYQTKGLAYILYKIEQSSKYSTFEVPKKSGGVRTIHAPCEKLKCLQRALANLLYECIEEEKVIGERLADFKGNNKQLPNRKRARQSVSHGYEQGLSIATNAEMHLGKRYVYNLDLENFFPSINFGRVRGFFIKNKKFKLAPKVATVIAQIACFENHLPQGSPSSPVISNLVAKGLDYQLLKLAKANSCTYTRYVDDITFSTNSKIFPKPIAGKVLLGPHRGSWRIGKELSNIIIKSGFSVNVKKCRMQHKDCTQEVTGLVVNRVVNVRSAYYRNLRSMCHSMFKNGYYRIPESRAEIVKEQTGEFGFIVAIKKLFIRQRQKPTHRVKQVSPQRESVDYLQGSLAHVYNIKSYRNKFARRGHRPARHDGIRTKANEGAVYPPLTRGDSYEDDNHVVALDGIKNLYGKFLFFKYFYFLDKPIIICEGKTDPIYLKCAVDKLSGSYPILAKDKDGVRAVDFFNRTETNVDMLKLAEGTSGLEYLILTYIRQFKAFKCEGRRYPVIIIVDKDDAGKGVIRKAEKIRRENRAAKKIQGPLTKHYFFENLFILAIPSKDDRCEIEDLFADKVLRTQLDGKSFNRSNKRLDENKEYGKTRFAEHVVKPNKKTIDFKGFVPLLNEIVEIISNYPSQRLD